MTPKRKTKIITLYSTLVIGTLSALFYIDSLTIDLDKMPEAKEVVLELEEKYDNSFVSSNIISSGATFNPIIAKVIKEIPPEVLQEVVTEVGYEKLEFFALELSKLPEEEIDWLVSLLKDFNSNLLKRLIRLSDRLGHKRTILLFGKLKNLPYKSQVTVIDILTKIPTSTLIKMVYYADDLTDRQVENLFVLIDKSSREKDLIEIMFRVPDELIIGFVRAFKNLDGRSVDKFVYIADRVPTSTIVQAMKLFIRYNDFYRVQLLGLVGKVNTNESITSIDVLYNMTKEHSTKAIDLILEDDRLMKTGIQLSDRLKKYLEDDGAYRTLERSINTASRVDKDTRYDGLVIIEDQVRSHALRKLFKQVDGQRDIYTDKTVKDLVDDYDRLTNKKRFVDILSGSQGVIHGEYRPADKIVTQERKLEVIKEVYSGNLQHRKEYMLEFFDRNSLIVSQIEEQDFIIVAPKK